MKKCVPFLLAAAAVAVGQDSLEGHLANLRNNPFEVPKVEQIVALGGREQAKLILESALASAIREPDDNPMLNRASMISFAILVGLDRSNAAALEYLRQRAGEAADLTAPPAFSPEVAAAPDQNSREPARFSPEFVEWVRARGNREPLVELYAINQYGQDLAFLSLAGDKGSAELIARALNSRQFSIVMGAVQALGRLEATKYADEALAASERLSHSDDERQLFGVPLMGFTTRLPDFRGKLRGFLRSDAAFRDLERRFKSQARE
jgi:hypothetical protein